MPRTPALLIDLDNTAYAYRPCHEAGLAAAGERAAALAPFWQLPGAFRRGYNHAREGVKKRVGPTAASHCRLLYFKALVEDTFARSDLDAAAALHDAYWAGYFGAMTRDPDCREVLRECRDRGFRTAWVTNFTTERQFLKLRALGLTDAADYVITSEEAGWDKPRPEIVRYALARLGGDPHPVWLVGDDPHDDGSLARDLGLNFVWFDRDGTGTEGLPDAPRHVRRWADLRAVLFP